MDEPVTKSTRSRRERGLGFRATHKFFRRAINFYKGKKEPRRGRQGQGVSGWSLLIRRAIIETQPVTYKR